MSLLKGFLAITLTVSVAQESSKNETNQLKPLPLFHYKPIYFVAGNPFAKIQVSFSTHLIDEWPIFFGYSQLMLWDVFAGSPRFLDQNYNPEVFYRWLLIPGRSWIDFGGFEHESNGRGGDLEKSWDRAYIRYHAPLYKGERTIIYGEIKAWYPISYNPHNADLARYRGVWEVSATIDNFLGEFFGRGDLTFRAYPGGPSLTDPLRGGQELTLRTQVRGTSWMPLIVTQIFHGYGETLYFYAVDHWGLRIGIGL